MIELMTTTSLVMDKKMDYPTFISWLNTRSIAPVTKAGNVSSMAGKYTQAALDNTGQLLMYGSSFGSHMTQDSLIHAVMLHACPNLTIANELRQNSRTCLYLVPAVSTFPSYPSVVRNGYTSRSYTSYPGSTLQDFVYYDATLGYMMRYNPSIGDTPVAFNGKLK